MSEGLNFICLLQDDEDYMLDAEFQEEVAHNADAEGKGFAFLLVMLKSRNVVFW